jgi:hypothetical protein
MADMPRTLKFIHFASQLCGISPYGSFLRNGGYEKPIICGKYLVYSFIFHIAVSVGLLRNGIRIFTDSKNASSEARRVNLQITLIFIFCFSTTYLVSAITRLFGVRNFFKISHKLLSVGSFANYHEGTAFSNAVIALHFVLFVNYCIRHSVSWMENNCQLYLLQFHICSLIRDSVTSFAAVQFLYFVFTLHRNFMLLNSSLNDLVVSTVKSDNNFPLNVPTLSDFLPKMYSVVSCLRDILYRHWMLCDILELINSSYSLQIMVFIGSKCGYATVFLFMLFLSMFNGSLFPVHSFPSLITLGCYEVMQLVTMVYCCHSASDQVGVI